MQLPGRLAAAIDILGEIETRHRPAATALADWGKAHRFAGSGDRAAIGTLVYDALRRRASSAHASGSDTARGVMVGMLARHWAMGVDEIGALFGSGSHGPAPLSADERAALGAPAAAMAAHVAGDFPAWLAPEFAAAFGDDAVAEGAALAERAPIDLRVNTLKATRDKVLAALAEHGAAAAPLAPYGIRIAPPERLARAPHVESLPEHGRGLFEVQDEGSQIAALLSGAGPRQQVLDLCAGAGGKTLALAAQMQNTGQLFAYDSDAHRLRPIFERLTRAGARNVQTLGPGKPAELTPLAGKMDVVLIDAPCSGSGTWRRRPDAKWRLSPRALAARHAEQRDVLALAAPLVRPGGRLVYVTCSVLPSENEEQIAAFLAAQPAFAMLPAGPEWTAAGFAAPFPGSAAPALRLSPHRTATDGFYVAVLGSRSS